MRNQVPVKQLWWGIFAKVVNGWRLKTVIYFRKTYNIDVWQGSKCASAIPTVFNAFHSSVAFHIETSHLICCPKQMTGFYMKRNPGLKWVKLTPQYQSWFVMHFLLIFHQFFVWCNIRHNSCCKPLKVVAHREDAKPKPSGQFSYFISPENTRKPMVFWCVSEVWNGSTDQKWVTKNLVDSFAPNAPSLTPENIRKP